MPSGAVSRSGAVVTGEATGARTARDATGTIGAAQTSSLITANADQLLQTWGHRRFVSRPLATTTLDFTNTPTQWTFSFAIQESALTHNMALWCTVYAWRPSTGAAVTTVPSPGAYELKGDEPTLATTEQAAVNSAVSSTGSLVTPILDGDILVFDISSQFTQSMSSAFTDQFFYDGTTEASATNCATFVTPPTALTLFTPRAKQSSVVRQAVNRSSVWMKGHSGIVVPRLWTPADSPGV